MLPARAGSIFRLISNFDVYSNEEGPKSENVEKRWVLPLLFLRGQRVRGGFFREGWFFNKVMDR